MLFFSLTVSMPASTVLARFYFRKRGVGPYFIFSFNDLRLASISVPYATLSLVEMDILLRRPTQSPPIHGIQAILCSSSTPFLLCRLVDIHCQAWVILRCIQNSVYRIIMVKATRSQINAEGLSIVALRGQRQVQYSRPASSRP
jgi:hypothetical protein